MRYSPGLIGLALSLLAAPALAQQDSEQIHLRFGRFDPLAPPAIPAQLQSPDSARLWILQFRNPPKEAGRQALRELGAEVHSYLPEYAYVLRAEAKVAVAARRLPSTRALLPYHPAFRLEPFLMRELLANELSDIPTRRYNLVVVDKHRDKPALARAIEAMGGKIEHEQPGSILFEASLDGRQLLKAAQLDQVLWIDRWTPAEEDMDNGRIQGGGNYVETQGGYTGKGINGHIYEGLEIGHKDFTNKPINVLSSGSAATHGHCTAGIVFGNGTSLKAARGMAPDAQAFFTHYGSVSSGFSRWKVVERLKKTHKVMFTTASWGNSRTRAYTSISADSDDIIFDHDMIWTQSQSNAGNQDSRPQAWAKNIFSIGGVRHRNNANPADDRWSRSGSTGPAADGRIKPDLCAYYDSILCSDRSGSAGYSSKDYTTSFGGTSGATPMVAGHNALAIQMFTDGLFGPKRKPNGTRWENMPHFTTLKALQIANAAQYSFTSTSTDNRREHVGWGFPSLKSMYDNRKLHFVVDETDLIRQGHGFAYSIKVAKGQPELKISMCYADPAANPSASRTRINDLTLRVTAPGGAKYWGNVGLEQGNYSKTGGSRNRIDTVENVFVKNPAPGTWKVEVLGYLVVKDSHVETKATDADFGLVVNGGRFVAKKPVRFTVGSMTPFGSGCVGTHKADVACVTANLSGRLRNWRGRSKALYLLEVRAPRALTVTGFEIKLASRRSGKVTIPAYLYDATTSNRPGKVLATGSMSVGSAPDFYRVDFGKKLAIKKGQRFFIGFKNANPTITIGVLSSGTRVPYWYQSSPTASWRYYKYYSWSYRVLCGRTGGLIPELSSNGVPELGGKYTVELRKVIPNTVAVLFTGVSNKLWGPVPLPFDMGPIGAKGCFLLSSTEILQVWPANAQGEVDAVLDVPKNKALLGFTFFHQWLVLDKKANRLGLITTNAVRARVGG